MRRRVYSQISLAGKRKLQSNWLSKGHSDVMQETFPSIVRCLISLRFSLYKIFVLQSDSIDFKKNLPTVHVEYLLYFLVSRGA